jgi:hypothetical protein
MTIAAVEYSERELDVFIGAEKMAKYSKELQSRRLSFDQLAENQVSI